MKSTLALRTFLVTLFLRRQVVVIRSILAPDSGQVTKKISHAQPHHQLLNGPALIWFVYTTATIGRITEYGADIFWPPATGDDLVRPP